MFTKEMGSTPRGPEGIRAVGSFDVGNNKGGQKKELESRPVGNKGSERGYKPRHAVNRRMGSTLYRLRIRGLYMLLLPDFLAIEKSIDALAYPIKPVYHPRSRSL